MAQGERVRQDILLGLLELSSVPLSADEIQRNFNADAQAAESRLEELAHDGYVEQVADGYYDIAPAGQERVLTRSPA